MLHLEERTSLNTIESIGIQLPLERCELALTEPTGRSNELVGLQNRDMLGGKELLLTVEGFFQRRVPGHER
jgi:hypothetical protein